MKYVIRVVILRLIVPVDNMGTTYVHEEDLAGGDSEIIAVPGRTTVPKHTNRIIYDCLIRVIYDPIVNS